MGNILCQSYFFRVNADLIIYFYLDTMALRDKFGNFSVLCLEVFSIVTIFNISNESIKYLNFGFESLSRFHLVELIVDLKRCISKMIFKECLIYLTIGGCIGFFLALETFKDVVELYQLELFMRHKFKTILGRKHKLFRSKYYLCKSIVDGELCEIFKIISILYKESILIGLNSDILILINKLKELFNSI